jgi:hypothetical protein
MDDDLVGSWHGFRHSPRRLTDARPLSGAAARPAVIGPVPHRHARKGGQRVWDTALGAIEAAWEGGSEAAGALIKRFEGEIGELREAKFPVRNASSTKSQSAWPATPVVSRHSFSVSPRTSYRSAAATSA